VAKNESDNTEERLARIEDILQTLLREAAKTRKVTAKIVDVVQVVIGSHASDVAAFELVPDRRGNSRADHRRQTDL
jgi:hypothetical protein